MQMKIGILTFHFSDNFGALLQAYALQEWLSQKGHDVHFLNYHPLHVEQGGSFQVPTNSQAIKANLKTLYLKISYFIYKYFGNKTQARLFEEFRRETLGVISTTIRDSVDLGAASSNFDLLITGSDQIWSPSVQFGFDSAYFLKFAPSGRPRKISYAPSFGRDSFGDKELNELLPLLNSLDSISVRESSGIEIVKKASGRIADCVPDPTFLIEDYRPLINSSTSDFSKHIFCYALRTGDGIRQTAERASQFYGAKIRSPYNRHRRWREIGTTIHPGPKDWLSELATAEFVVTNSFHGTAFAILLKRPFVVVGLPGFRKQLNSRAMHLLAQHDLTQRFIPYEEIENCEQIFRQPIDWQAVTQRQNELRLKGTEYLERELSRVHHD